MIEKGKTRQNYWKRAAIKEELGGSPTGDEVLDYICGTPEGHESDFVLYRYDEYKRSIFNRVNLLWVYPIFILMAIPCWLINGGTGVSRDSRIGKVVNWLVGFDE